jgi:hypothetical protein
MARRKGSIGVGKSLVTAAALFAGLNAGTAEAQLQVSLQAGVHLARTDRPDRELIDPNLGVDIEGASGESRTLGLRLGLPIAGPLALDAGIAWSRNQSWQGSRSFPSLPPGNLPEPPGSLEFTTETFFTSATLGVRLTRVSAPVSLTVGAGPAVVVHGGSGNSLLAHDADWGGLARATLSIRVAHRLALSLEAQGYGFSSEYRGSYQDALSGQVHPPGRDWRTEVVLLAGLVVR